MPNGVHLPAPEIADSKRMLVYQYFPPSAQRQRSAAGGARKGQGWERNGQPDGPVSGQPPNMRQLLFSMRQFFHSSR